MSPFPRIDLAKWCKSALQVATSGTRSGSARRRSLRAAPPLAGIESLETRTLLAAKITAQIGVENGRNILDVVGTEKADTIYIEQSPRTGIFYVATTNGGEDLGKFRDVHEIRVSGLGGDDRLDMHGSDGINPPQVKVILSGGKGKDKLVGGDGDDHLDGGDGDDTLIGGKGADLMAGQKGKDLLLGEDGNDVMYGGGGGSTPESGGKEADRLFGGRGDDSIWGGGGDDSLYGGLGLDSLYGGSGKDLLIGEEGFDYLFGNAGIDRLYGEFEKSGGKTDVENWLEAGAFNEKGAAAEVATDGFTAFKPVVDGMQFKDIRQEGSPSCAFLASLAATVKTGHLTDKQIVYKGNFTYSLRLFEPDPAKINQGKEIFVETRFDGKIVNYDDGESTSRLDPGTPNYEFWTTLYQRAYFLVQHLFDYVKTPADLDKFGGENAVIPMARLMKYRFVSVDRDSDDFTGDNIKSIIGKGFAVTTSLQAMGRDDTLDSDLPLNKHAYMISDIIYDDDGDVEFVELYNPWGKSKLHGTYEGKEVDIIKTDTDGLFRIEWSYYEAMARRFGW